jgi:hypothetical protein
MSLFSQSRSACTATNTGPSVRVGRTVTLMTIRHDINRWLDKAEARGWATYGRSLEDANDGRDWTIELIEELIDALQYAAKEIHDLRQQLRTPFD